MAICFCQDHRCYLNIYCPPSRLKNREKYLLWLNRLVQLLNHSASYLCLQGPTVWCCIQHHPRTFHKPQSVAQATVTGKPLNKDPPTQDLFRVKEHTVRFRKVWIWIQFLVFSSVCHCNCFLMKLQTIAAFNEIQKLKKRKRYCISCCEITATFLHCLTFRVSNVYNITISSWIKCCLSNLVNLAKWD